MAGLPDYTRRTRTRSPVAEKPPGAVRKAARSSPVRSRSSWATIGWSASTRARRVSIAIRPAGAGRGRHTLGHECVPRSRSPGPGEARPQGRVRGRQPGASRRSAPSARRRDVIRRRPGLPARRAWRRPVRPRPPRPRRPRAAPDRDRPGWWSSRMPGGARRSAGRGVPAVRGRARRRRRRGAGAGVVRRAPSARSSSASLSARIAVRCWPREAKPARSRPSSSNTRSSRCGPTSVEPFQTSFSAVSARRRARASRRLARSPRAFVSYRIQPRGASSGAISACAPARARRGRLRSVADGPRRRRCRRRATVASQ